MSLSDSSMNTTASPSGEAVSSSTAVPSTIRGRLSRKRPIAASLPSIGYQRPANRGNTNTSNTMDVLREDESEETARDEDSKRRRFESDSSSQSSISSSSSSPSDSDDSGSSRDVPHIVTMDEGTPSTASSSSTVFPPDCIPIYAHPNMIANMTDPRVSVNCITNTPVTVKQTSDKTARIVIGNNRRGQDRGALLVNNSQVGEYTIVGMGKECSAIHNVTGEVVTAQLISRSDWEIMQQVAERLDKAEEMCEGRLWDVADLCERIIPSSCEVVEEDDGRLVLFSPLSHSSLHSYLFQKEGPFGLSEKQVANIHKQVAGILALCHEVGILVRDLKPRKLVFTDKDCTSLRLSDVFDVAVCESRTDDVVTEKFGSPAYVPPEVLVSRQTGFAGRPADIWGLGVLTYLLLTGKYPFYDGTPMGVFKKIRRAVVLLPGGLHVSRAARAMVYGTLRKDPEERPTAAELYDLPWLVVNDCAECPRQRLNHMASPMQSVLRMTVSNPSIVFPVSSMDSHPYGVLNHPFNGQNEETRRTDSYMPRPLSPSDSFTHSPLLSVYSIEELNAVRALYSRSVSRQQVDIQLSRLLSQRSQ